MKKRSAMLVAAGLVLAMVVAGLGFTMGLTGPTADAKRVSVGRTSQKPIVHTKTKTITIHKQAESQSSDASIVYSDGTAPGTSGATTSSYGDDSYEHDSYEHESESESDGTSSYSEGTSSTSSESGDD